MFNRVGELFLVRPHSLTEEELSLYKEFSFQNFLFFKEHFEQDFQAYLEELKKRVKKLKLLAVDQEGGRVARISGEFEAPLEMAKKSEKEGLEIFKSWAERIAKSLKEHKLNTNLAPVVDLAEEEAEDFLRGRTLGEDPYKVTQLASLFIKTHQKWGIKTTLKHFPGLGEVKIDPHKELPVKEKVSPKDLIPYIELSQEVDFIMTTHLILWEWDNIPVTFSSRAVKFLRENLSYRGAILTDDLNMGALKELELPERIVRAIASGHNLLIFCGSFQELISALEDLKPELEKSSYLRSKIKESLTILERY